MASCYYLYSAELTAKAAAALGKGEDALLYTKLAEEVREAIRKEYFTSTGRIAVDTQTAMVLALRFGIVPEGAKERLIQSLKTKLEEEKIHLTTGFVGTPYLCPVLTENGLAEYAYTLLLNEDFPSWLYEVNMGATTIWERWNSVLPDGSISDTGMNSLNHYSYGSIVEWMYRYMCGINPDEHKTGFRKFTIHPYPDQRFEYVKAEYQSAYGLIKSGWEKTKEGWRFCVTVPFDTEGEFILEEKIRDWAIADSAIIIICGPIINQSSRTIGKNKVAVPERFFKVVLSPFVKPVRGIGFLFNNRHAVEPLSTYAVTIDSIEKLTNMDFFSPLPDEIENEVEANADYYQWPH